MNNEQQGILLKLGEGVLLVDLPLDGITAAAQIRSVVQEALRNKTHWLARTLPGTAFTALPKYKVMGVNTAENDPDMLLHIGWDARLKGTLTDFDPQAVALLMGPGHTETDEDQVTLIPQPDSAEIPTHSLCWASMTGRGMPLVLLPHVMSTGGLSLMPGQNRDALIPFCFQVMAKDHEECFRLILRKNICVHNSLSQLR